MPFFPFLQNPGTGRSAVYLNPSNSIRFQAIYVANSLQMQCQPSQIDHFGLCYT
jgi:hypothetical protein